MSIVYLNGRYLPMNEARISPMDRGFLFGDAIYEVIPSYHGRLVGFSQHIQRMKDGLKALEIQLQVDVEQWRNIAATLVERNEGANLGIYIQVSRGADMLRAHVYPEGIEPTVYAFTFDIPPAQASDKTQATRYRVSTTEDLRWKRCQIKTTALLGNVMHLQRASSEGNNEVILYNADDEITEAAASNIYVIKRGTVATPSLDYQKLPGITRSILLDILRSDGGIPVEERVVKLDELRRADEVWLSSASKEIAPVVEIDGELVGDGSVGDVWQAAMSLYSARKFDY